MVNQKQSKRQRDIKTKLMAAICMLLVSSVMMVSTTYAWFTLSTAPEVTGITTAVGANGNLEMALMPSNGLTAGKDFGITSSAGDSMASQDATLANITWGNLVDLSDSTYGLDQITLYPSALNAATSDASGNPLTLDLAALLQTPAYGADGRVSDLLKNTVTSTYDAGEENFPQNELYGVRAVGTASGMTDRQLAYRNARSAASTAMAQAKTLASQSLNTNGAALANIALAHGVNAAATHTSDDVDALEAIVADLLGDGNTTGVLQHIENAYRNYIIAYGASQDAVEAGIDDTEFGVFKSAVESAESLSDAMDQLTTYGVTLPDAIKNPVAELAATRASVESAQEDLNNITATENIPWGTISVPLYKLADTDEMEINGIKASEIKQGDNMSKIVNSVASGGLTVTIATGGGVYADITDHCGDFTASITIAKVEYNGLALKDMTARMATKTTVSPVYLSVLSKAVEEAESPSGEGGEDMPISDMYGYIIDLAFRTNAAESNLLLQVNAADRIYSDNGTDAETMGHGSSMTFTSTTTDFTLEKMKELMGAIRIVFFDPANNNTVLATAKLDMTNTEDVGGNTCTAKMYLYTLTAGGTTTEYVEAAYVVDDADAGTFKLAVDGESATHALIDGEYVEATHALKADSTTEYEEVETGATHAVKTTTTNAGETKLTDNVITALTQNTAKAVSVLVYLDGENMGNDDVAATAATSMKGTMNLQFASSANLVPMEYTPLLTN